MTTDPVSRAARKTSRRCRLYRAHQRAQTRFERREYIAMTWDHWYVEQLVCESHALVRRLERAAAALND